MSGYLWLIRTWKDIFQAALIRKRPNANNIIAGPDFGPVKSGVLYIEQMEDHPTHHHYIHHPLERITSSPPINC